MFEIGAQIDRYLLEAELGHGGMGRVYRAYDSRLNRRIALKVLLAIDDDARARLSREAQAAAAFEHPNAVGIYDVGELDGVPFIAMELVKGRTLATFVGDPSVSWRTKLSWLLEVARVLGAAHRVSLVHRDVKPDNVMLSDEGRIKVLDFGIARHFQGASRPQAGVPLKSITAKGLLVGTPQYMAPEYVQGRQLDGRADQFAWGVMAYEVLSGAAPWVHGDPIALMASILFETPPPLGPRVPDLPADVEAAILRCLEKEPELRHDDMESLVAALEGYCPCDQAPSLGVRRSAAGPLLPLKNTPTPLPPPSSVTVAPVKKRRKWLGIGLGLGIAAALAAGVGGVGMAMRHRAASSAAERTSSQAAAAAAPAAKVALSTNPQANAAYLGGLQAMHDAVFEVAARRFEQATTLDSSFAAAHLRAAILLLRIEPTRARAHFQEAVQHRATLDARDQAMLDALDPLIARDPPGYAETERRLVVTNATFPEDPELLYLLSWTRFFQGKFDESRMAIDDAERADPTSAVAALHRAGIEMFGGTREGAMSALEKCLARAPGATYCLKRRVRIEELDGRCADAERDARQWLTTDPDSSEARRSLAQTLVALGKPLAAAEDLLKQGHGRAPENDRRRVELEDRDVLAELQGDFGAAERTLLDLSRVVDTAPELAVHQGPAFALLGVYAETGDTAKAGGLATNYLARKDAWVAPPGLDNFALEVDLTPTMLAVERRRGAITSGAFDEKLEAWLAGWKERLPKPYRGFLWVYGFAATVETHDQAVAALAALPAYEPLPPLLPGSIGDAVVGRVYALAGRYDEALPLLERASKSCAMFDDPTRSVQVHAWLGQAREQKGDVRGACAEYKVVLNRWGRTAPRTVTTKLARTRATQLHCAR